MQKPDADVPRSVIAHEPHKTPAPQRSSAGGSHALITINGAFKIEFATPVSPPRNPDMRSLVLAAALLLLPAVARADVTIQQAAHEARSFLKPCHHSNVDRQGECQMNEFNFVESYVRALSGDYMAQGDIYSSFSVIQRVCANCGGQFDLGLPANQQLACAWAMLFLLEPKTADGNSMFAQPNAHRECAPLTHRALSLATTAAIALRLRIQDHPVHLPPNWDPAEHDLFPPTSRLLPHPLAPPRAR